MYAQVRSFKTGDIILWAGAIANIRSGWHLCDGTAGTPNLKNSFIVGAGDTYLPGYYGGATDHLHTAGGANHTHTLEEGEDLGFGSDFSILSDAASAMGNTGSGSNLPPYYALAYIMKL